MKHFLYASVCILFLSACSTTAQETADQTDNQQNSESKDIGETVENDEETASTDERETEKDATEEKSMPQYEIQESNWSIQPVQEDVDAQKVLVTIDDAPDTYSLDMAEYLAEQEIPAIFFINGHFLHNEESKEQLKKIHDLGFEIGNHTMTHVNLSDISAEETEKEIVEVNDMIEKITGERPTFFRAPFGVNTDASKEVLKEEGMTWMNWTYGYDWEADYMNAEALTDIMLNTELLSDGANLLMHDREWTKNALPDIIEGFQSKGYGFIDPSQIITNEKAEPSQ
ncbi:polysaccharide deacetylase family protein [Bacillus piscicola]|uniref:polysaccharide deacetylase family protein n=1 Tax=Bacillus piscicola TaxID=1632684 RepID=UPI001F093CA8